MAEPTRFELATSGSTIQGANWEADNDNRWTIPLGGGGGGGKVFKIGPQPLNLQTQVFYNVEKPDLGPEWSLRVQLQFLFPKK